MLNKIKKQYIMSIFKEYKIKIKIKKYSKSPVKIPYEIE